MTTELSHPFRLVDLGDGEVHVDLEADAAERQGLAKRFDLVAIEVLRASLALRRTANGRIGVRGRLTAEVVQTCVVSLEPIAQRLEAEISRAFAEDAEDTAKAEEVEIEPLSADLLEPLRGETLDLGEVVAEELGLAIEPYPRKPDARLPAEPIAGAAPSSPFAALARLRREG